MKTKELERSIKTIIQTGAGYSNEFLPVLRNTKNILKKINKGRKTAENYYRLGKFLLDLEDSQLALDAFQTGYKLDKNHVHCGTYYALLLEQFERTNEALYIYLQINETNPENIEIAERMLAIYDDKVDLRAVLTLCQYFLSKGLNYPIIHRYLAKAYNELSDNASAVRHIETSLSLLEDDEADKYINLLVAFYFLNKDSDKILALKDNIFSIKSTKLTTKLMYATSLAEVGKLSEARSVFCSLYVEQKNQSDKNNVLVDIALFHINAEYDYNKAEFINRYILKKDPANVHALTNLSLFESDEFALNAYEKLHEQYPEHLHFRYNYGYSLINVRGDFVKGYELFESRIPLKVKFLSKVIRNPKTLDNNRIFIWKEQGVGDHIWIAWFFQFLAKLNTKTTIQVDKRLLPLMNRSFPSLDFTGKDHKEVIITENIDYNYDYEIMLYSLGKYFIEDIKKAQKDHGNGVKRSSYLIPDENKSSYWQQKLKSITGKKIVGICWRSGKQDALRNKHYMSVDEIIQIFSNIDCYVVNLQYDYTSNELHNLSDALGKRFINFPEIDLKSDFDNLSALIKPLDLVFSAATSVHALSSAIGVNTLCFTHLGKNSKVSLFGKDFNFAYPNTQYTGVKNKLYGETLGMYSEKITNSLNTISRV